MMGTAALIAVSGTVIIGGIASGATLLGQWNRHHVHPVLSAFLVSGLVSVGLGAGIVLFASLFRWLDGHL